MLLSASQNNEISS